MHYRRTDCRACRSSDLVKVLDLGEQPPANAFLTRDRLKDEAKFPLALYFCRGCGLAQLLDVVDPKVLFNSNYKFATGASAPLVEHFKKYAEDDVIPLIDGKETWVYDIGGNDDTLLNFIRPHCHTMNIDPAAKVSPCEASLFTLDLAEYMREHFMPPKVITANNVCAHVDDIEDFFAGVKHLLRSDGTFILQVHWIGDLIERGCFDQIYHEHLCYWSMTSLMRALLRVNLHVAAVKFVECQGTSIRVFVKHKQRITAKHDQVVTLLADEDILGLTDEQTFIEFGNAAQDKKKLLEKLYIDLREDSFNQVIGYGAPAKGNTLLNYVGIGLDYLVDTTPAKQGLYSPGQHIEVRSEIDKIAPDYALLLAWNYKDEILEKEKDRRAQGMRFIIPFPEVTIV